jgi:hypothetical protein
MQCITSVYQVVPVQDFEFHAVDELRVHVYPGVPFSARRQQAKKIVRVFTVVALPVQ